MPVNCRPLVFAIGMLCAAAFSRAQPVHQQASSPAGLAAVPFVGCARDGQVGPSPAPRGQPRLVGIDPSAARELAYYSDGMGIGVLAPRGWYCFGTYGSSGSTLYVSRAPLDTANLGPEFTGGVIQASVSEGGTSGRFEVAHAIARVFPAHMAFARKVMSEGFEPASSFKMGPFPRDRLTRRGTDVVEYLTPPNSDGLGVAESRLKPSNDPISGVAILQGEDTDLLFLAARLPPDLAVLTPTIVTQFEKDAVEIGSGG